MISATVAVWTGTPGSSAIEIDDVDPARAGRANASTTATRVVAVHRLAGEVPLDEPNHPSAAQVDRRQELEWSLALPRPRP